MTDISLHEEYSSPVDQSGYYVLDENNEPQKVSSTEWGKWFNDTSNRRIGLDAIFFNYRPKKGGNDCSCFISTVFIGMPHGISKDNRLLLFETWVSFPDLEHLDDINDCYLRTSTYEQAECAHKLIKVLMTDILRPQHHSPNDAIIELESRIRGLKLWD